MVITRVWRASGRTAREGGEGKREREIKREGPTVVVEVGVVVMGNPSSTN